MLRLVLMVVYCFVPQYKQSPEVFADWLAGDLQDDHGWVQLSEGFDGRDVNCEDI